MKLLLRGWDYFLRMRGVLNLHPLTPVIESHTVCVFLLTTAA
jgi:hypothetical protein